MLVVFMGPPGAGKGTQSKRLAEQLEIPHCSTGDMFRDACQRQTDVGRKATEYLQSGRLVPDSLVEQLVVERLDHLADQVIHGAIAKLAAGRVEGE